MKYLLTLVLLLMASVALSDGPTLVIDDNGSLTLHGQPVTVVDQELKAALINIATALHPQPPNEVCVEQINILLKELERCKKDK